MWDVLSETRGCEKRRSEAMTIRALPQAVSETVPFTGHGEDHRAPPYGTLYQGTETVKLTWKADLEAE